MLRSRGLAAQPGGFIVLDLSRCKVKLCFISCDREDNVVLVKSGNPVTAPLSSLAPAPASRGRLHGDGQKEPLPARGLQESAPPGLVDAAAQRR